MGVYAGRARVDRDLGVLLTDNDTIAAYNQHFRGKAGPTDILSFPFHVRGEAVPSPLPPPSADGSVA